MSDPATDDFNGEGYFVRCADCGGYHRSEAPGFRDLIAEACTTVEPTTMAIYEEFGLSDAGGSWAYDGDTCLMTFTNGQGRRSNARFHRVGTWLPDSGSFKWAWDADAPDPTRSAVARLRGMGTDLGFDVLVQPLLLVGKKEAWHLAKLTAWASNLPLVYSVPVTETCRSFMALERPVWEHS